VRAKAIDSAGRRALRARGGGSKIQKPKTFWREDFLEGNTNAKGCVVTDNFLLEISATPPRTVVLRPCEAPRIRFSPTLPVRTPSPSLAGLKPAKLPSYSNYDMLLS